MKNLFFTSAFCVKTSNYFPVKLSLSSSLAPALHGKKLNSCLKNTTRSVLVSLALFSLSCLPACAGTGNGLTANYRTGLDAANSPIVLTRTDATVNFDWGRSSPAPGVPVDRFSVKWYGFIEPKYTEEYTFYTTADEGESLLINGTQIINDTIGHTARTASGKVKLQAGVKYPIILYYFEKTGAASMKLEWSSANQSREVVPTSQLYSTSETWSPPVQITKGGIYTGQWRSTDPDIPAVKVLTNEPVTIQNCQIESAGDGIWSLGVDSNLTVRNCQGQGLNPNIANRKKGYFINVGNFSKVTIENNTVVSFGQGIRALNYGTGTQLRGQTLGIRYNFFKNVDGRLSDGQSNYLTDMTDLSGAIALNTLVGANVEISWNQVINQPFISSVADMISKPVDF